MAQIPLSPTARDLALLEVDVVFRTYVNLQLQKVISSQSWENLDTLGSNLYRGAELRQQIIEKINSL